MTKPIFTLNISTSGKNWASRSSYWHNTGVRSGILISVPLGLAASTVVTKKDSYHTNVYYYRIYIIQSPQYKDPGSGGHWQLMAGLDLEAQVQAPWTWPGPLGDRDRPGTWFSHEGVNIEPFCKTRSRQKTRSPRMPVFQLISSRDQGFSHEQVPTLLQFLDAVDPLDPRAQAWAWGIYWLHHSSALALWYPLLFNPQIRHQTSLVKLWLGSD